MTTSMYHQITVSQMCAAGQSLRMRALKGANRVKNGAWNRETATPADRKEMLDQARQHDGPEYSAAWQEWLTHYHNCKQCQEALKW